MNPSAKGWIPKLLDIIAESPVKYNSWSDLYTALLHSGFIYGHATNIVLDFKNDFKYSPDENNKINLLTALHTVYNWQDKSDFEADCLSFYKELTTMKRFLISDILGKKKGLSLLEDIIGIRVLSISNPFSKSFNILGNNMFMFLDVIAFKNYLIHGDINKAQLKALELYLYKMSVKLCDSSSYSELLLKAIAQSLRYNDPDSQINTASNSFIEEYNHYVLDFLCMAAWEPEDGSRTINTAELNNILGDLKLTTEQFNAQSTLLNAFYSKHSKNLYMFNSKSVIQNIYSNSTNLVVKLINRNKKRLTKELQESKQLLNLLAISTTRPLTKDEQRAVHNQLLDIFKSIPSLAIFLLPGGTLLLPLVVKLIPNLLPSSFNDNKLDSD